MDTFILTLKLDDASFEKVQSWRVRHFPAALNHLPAHLTLLHTVSSEQVDRLRDSWHTFEAAGPLVLRMTRPRHLGRGVAIDVESTGLQSVRARIIDAMGGGYTPQDQHFFRAHITIQNKVTSAESKALFETLRSGFEPWEGQGDSILVWKYLGGPWALQSELRFNG